MEWRQNPAVSDTLLGIKAPLCDPNINHKGALLQETQVFGVEANILWSTVVVMKSVLAMSNPSRNPYKSTFKNL